MKKRDFLIVGQGLAGSLLAYRLIKYGQSVLVLDNHNHGSASMVAAGLINPITGHRLNITEHFFDFVESAKKLYWQIERDLGCSIYRELAQTRLIKNAGQADFLKQRQQQENYAPLLANVKQTGPWFGDDVQFPFGRINVAMTATVDTKQLLHHVRHWLQERGALMQTRMDYNALNVEPHGITLSTNEGPIAAQKVVFCEGHQATQNPWLSNLPFKLAKGEILTLIPDTPVDRMLSWGKWLVPYGADRAKLGSNFIWNDTSLLASANTQKTFLNELKIMTGLTATVQNHEVGVRPSTKQRKPFVGPLSSLPNAFCLNGFGSKGCLIAPHHVELLCQHMLHQRALPEELTQWL